MTRSGKRIDLTAKEFGLLELLMRRQGEVLPRSLIASQVWDVNFDSDTNVIEVAMRRLRAKVDDGFEPRLIQTVRGMGYVLEVPEDSLMLRRLVPDRATDRFLYTLVSAAVLVGLASWWRGRPSRHFVELDRDYLLDKIQLVQKIVGETPSPAELLANAG